jgi:hypothetical protein
LELAVARLDPFTGTWVSNIITLSTGTEAANRAVQN